VQDDLWPLIDAGEVRPVIGEYLPITSAGRAHELVERGDQLGKVVLDVRA
jgi:NADPH:quinone reductase-like Zn-dependent oxidoreductase